MFISYNNFVKCVSYNIIILLEKSHNKADYFFFVYHYQGIRIIYVYNLTNALCSGFLIPATTFLIIIIADIKRNY